MLTWKQIKQAVEKDNPIYQIQDDDLLTYVVVHMDSVGFGVVGQDGFVAHANYNNAKLTQTQNLPVDSKPASQLAVG